MIEQNMDLNEIDNKSVLEYSNEDNEGEILQKKDLIRRPGELLESPNRKKNKGNYSQDERENERESVLDRIVKLTRSFFREHDYNSGNELGDILTDEDLRHECFDLRNAVHNELREEREQHIKEKITELRDILEDDQETTKPNENYRNLLDILALKVWEKIANDTHDPKSMMRAAFCYYKGKQSVEPRIDMALHYWKQAAHQNDKNAAILLARFYQSEMFEGNEMSNNTSHKKEHDNNGYDHEENAEGEKRSYYEVEDVSNSTKDLSQEQYQESRTQDDEVGILITDTDLPVNDNDSISRKNFLRYTVLAASEGDAQSLKTLGLIYQDGLFGVKSSLKKALKMYLKAAEKDELFSMFKAAEIYYYGAPNVPSDRKAALEILAKAADVIPLPNWDILGNLYRFGASAPNNKPDFISCIKCYKKAISAGSTYSLKALADVYWNIITKLGKDQIDEELISNFPDLNTESIFELYEKAAALGEESALLGLAKCYWRGVGVVKNVEKCKGVLEKILRRIGNDTTIVKNDDDAMMSFLTENDILDD